MSSLAEFSPIDLVDEHGFILDKDVREPKVLMIASGLDIRTVQDIGGHKDIKTTMNYAHLLAEKIREAARTFSIKPAEEIQPDPRNYLRLVKNS